MSIRVGSDVPLPVEQAARCETDASADCTVGSKTEATAPGDACGSESSTIVDLDAADSPRSSDSVHGVKEDDSGEGCVLTIRALNGDVLCTLATHLPANSRWKVSDLRQKIEATTGIQAYAQKLISGDEELDRLYEFTVKCDMEITLLRRSQKVVEWIQKLKADGTCEAFANADADVKGDPLICLAALSVDGKEPWQYIDADLLRDDEFLAAALEQDSDMFRNTRCLATNMDFLTGCAKLRASGRMNWGSRGPIFKWSHGGMLSQYYL